MKFYPTHRNEEQTRRWIQNYVKQQTAMGFSKWLIELKSSSTPIGYCGLVPTDVDGVTEIELGYFLDPNFWGRGYATEAAKAVLDTAHRFQIQRVISAINPANVPSLAVAKRLGMNKEKVGTASAPGLSWEAEIWAKSV